MSNRLRRIVAMVAATLIFSMTISSTAKAQSYVEQGDASNAPAVVDVLILRPAGFVSFAVGIVLFVVSSPIVLITRPHEIGTPFKQLVMRPAKYIWSDPIGGH